MRLLVFHACGGCAVPEVSLPEKRRSEDPLTPSNAEKAVPLSPASSAAGVDKRRRRTASLWRPSLGAINEDSAPPLPPAAEGKSVKRIVGSASARSRSKSRVHSPTNRDDLRNSGIPAFVPAFAPTAFIF